MATIKCPKCGEEITLNKSEYDALLSEVEKEEVEKRVASSTKTIEEKLKAQYALEAEKAKQSQDKTILGLQATIKVMEEKIANSGKEQELAIVKALEKAKDELNKKEQALLKAQSETVAAKKDAELNAKSLKEKYDFELKAKDEEIERYKNFRLGDSTKDLGESLEQYCHDAFDEIRSYAYPRAYFEKDNDVDEEGKGDFIFRDYAEDGTEIVSIMFEMKNQKEDTDKASKHKNEEFFKKLDKNRSSKGCEYAVLVSTLEEDSKLYNTGIVDVSHRYPKMYVIRPQQFLAIIGLLRNMALNTLTYKKQVIAYQQENLDITNFEAKVRAIGEKIGKDYANANKIYDSVDAMCDDIVKKVNKFRDDFRVARDWIGKAENQLPELEVRKLTRGNATMKEKFAELE